MNILPDGHTVELPILHTLMPTGLHAAYLSASYWSGPRWRVKGSPRVPSSFRMAAYACSLSPKDSDCRSDSLICWACMPMVGMDCGNADL